MEQESKRYWIKIEKSFLDNKYMKIIRGLENGTDYILFYLALMLESVETVGHLRMSELVPYDEKMLSALTGINVDIVRSALKLFIELGMVELLSDGTFFLPEVPKATGKESSSAERVRKYRERKKLEAAIMNGAMPLQCNNEALQCNPNKEKEEEEQEQEEKKEKKKEPRTKYGEYKHVFLTDSQYSKLLEDWGQSELDRMIRELDEGIELKGYKYKNHSLALRNWKKNERSKDGSARKPHGVGFVTCPHCGANTPDHVDFCIKCGKEVE